MKGLVDWVNEQLEVETISDKLDTWFINHPEEALLWAKACKSYDEIHVYDEKALAEFIASTNIKELMKFLQDDINSDMSGNDVTEFIRKIIANRK